ncbi:nucleoside hydrolase [Naasia aerilata]|uniref:Nucleoside hydrolase n=1 Tax=Naasia aerilata TaxID=1162966 RepID=A0ABM8GH40_9MICO|nr:nucleoside hydrolase [Naasia aerilata]BDZ47685.1 nucleoside hydrolase [Naasia aerilata]
MIERQPVLVDCDTGIDDAVALLYLLSVPSIEIVGITTVSGNAPARACAINTLTVLALAGRTDIPVAVGAERPFLAEPRPHSVHVHGYDGMGDAGLPPADPALLDPRSALQLIDDLSCAHAGRLRILATGAFTNLALAVRADPTLVGRIADVVVMGGAAEVPGNMTPAAEANIAHDPEGAAVVLSAGWPIAMVPLDVTTTELLTEEHVERLTASGEVGRFVAAISDYYMNFYAPFFGRRVAVQHDALAAGILAGDVVPTVFPLLRVEVECGPGPARGATVCDTRGRHLGYPDDPDGNCRVALRTPGGFVDLLVDRLAAMG